MKMEGIRGKILAVTIMVCSLWIGTFSFTLDAVANEVTTYDLTVTVISGHGTVEPNSGSYSAGTVVTLTAMPETGYVVRQWTGTDDDTSCALTNTVTMDSDKTVTVEFGQRCVFVVGVQYVTIQDAIDAAACGDIVIVPAVVHFGNINFHGKNIRVTSTSPDDPMCVASTVIQGSGAGPVVTFSGSESQSCWLDGLTITGGNTTGDGGGICGNGTEAKIANCVITNNHADGYGGGVSNCNGRIVGCTITGNTAGSFGGGVYLARGGVPQVRQCLITGNTAGEKGGGLLFAHTPAVIENCIIKDNVAEGVNGSGGAISFYGGYVTHLVKNCLIMGNSATISGGAISADFFATPEIRNCTFSENSTGSFGGAIFCDWSSDPIITDSIFQNCNNHAIYEEEVGNAIVTYSLFHNNIDGDYGIYDSNTGLTTTTAGVDLDVTNIEGDPLFVTGLFGNYYLNQKASPAVNNGSDTAVNLGLDAFTTDPNGVTDTGQVDIGYHYSDRLLAPRYKLTIILVGDHGTVEPNSGSYFAGTVVTLTAMPEAGYMLRQWTGTDDDTSCALTNTVTMDSDKTVTVEFGLPTKFSVVPGQIQEAIDAAACGDTLIVSAGVHYGDINFNGKNIRVFSTNPEDPNIVALTIIQGSGTGPVVTFSGSESQSCLLDGLTITGGNTTGDGGGICGNGTEATIANCVITNNHADGYGGGVSNCNGTIVRCTITGNTAGIRGGGICVVDCNVSIEDCDINYNAADYGGGICVVDCNVSVEDCDINYNVAAHGAGLFCAGSPGATITRCTITDNDAYGSEIAGGGGIFVWGSPILIEDCRISRNSAMHGGGGLYLAGDTDPAFGGLPQVRNCLITENTAGEEGGGISCEFYAEPLISNCTIADNAVADGYGGGLCCSYDSHVEVINSIIWGNSAEQGFQVAVSSGDQAYHVPSTLALSYSDVEGGPGGAYVELGCMLDWGIGTIDLDPQLVDPNGGDWHLGVGSPCIDAGDNTAVPPSVLTDLDGNPRIRGNAVDMGAYEFPMCKLTVTVVSGHGTVEPNSGSYFPDTVVTLTATPEAAYYVVRQWTGTDDDTSCELTNTVTMDSDKTVTVEFGLPHTFVVGAQYVTIQDAIDAAGCGDIVIVPTGVYFGNIDFHGKNIIVSSVNPDDPDVVASTVIHGSGAGPVVTFSGSESQSCWLDGLTITGGNTTGDSGGICGNGTEATIANCIITNNHADGYGGGVSNCNGRIVGCTITGNTAGSGGGGIHVVDCNVSVEDCDINYNAAPYGGGLYCWDSPGATITRCTITDNDANGSGMAYGGGICVFESLILIEDCQISRNSAMHGGGVYFSGSDQDPFNNPLLHNCLVTLNRAGRDGGGISVNWFAEPVISNCTIASNRVTSAGGVGYGGGLSSSYESNVDVINSIIWGNFAQQGFQVAVCSGDLAYPLPSMLALSHSDVEGGPGGAYVGVGSMLDWGIGTIDSDPQMVDPNGGDWHLGVGSPCIDAGDNTAVPPSVLTDLDGRPRIINGTVDMGAYEFQILYVDDDAPKDPGPGDSVVSDPLENGTEAHPFDTIQEAIDVAQDGYAVLVRLGSYLEPASDNSIDFLGKNITLTSADPTDWDIVDNTVIRGYVQFSGAEGPTCKFAGFRIHDLQYGAIYGNHTHATISHCNISGNGPCGATVIKDCDGIISNCLITDNMTVALCGIYPVVFGCNGLIKNCTIVNNISGVSVGTATIENCIIYNNFGSQLAVTNGEILNISYSNVQGGLAGIAGDGSVNWGPGNIDTDPCFVRLGYWVIDDATLIEGDYHLKSEGHYWSKYISSWTYDDYVTSRCIDAGNPGSPLGDELMSVPRDPNNVWGVNIRINMGAYGGTGQASIPPHGWALLADLNNDGTVNFWDFAYQTQDWLTTALEQPGDLNRDGVMNMLDLAALAENWLQVTDWVE